MAIQINIEKNFCFFITKKNILKIRILNIYIIKLFYYKKQLFLITIIPQTLSLRN